MTPELEARLREVYPTGKNWEPSAAKLDWGFREEAAEVLELLPP